MNDNEQSILLGIDIGGTNIRIGVFQKDRPSRLLEKKQYTVDRNFDIAIGQLVKDIRDIANGRRVAGIGVGAPGIINTEEGFIISSANLSSWERKPIADSLQKALSTTVKVYHDVAVAAAGDALYGHGNHAIKFIYIIWGTGVGGVVVEQDKGKLNVTSFEPGHQILDWNGPQCPCGQPGCVEVYLGGKNAEKYYHTPLSDVTDDGIWDDIAQKASHFLINTIMHFPVDLIIFGGGVISKQPHLLKRISAILSKRLSFFPVPTMKLSAHGEDSGLYGAAGLVLQEL